MIKLILIVVSITITPLAGCGYYDTGKEILVDKPMDSSKRRQKLLDAREMVEKSRRNYENCLKKNPEDESRCENYKKSYEKDVETYSSLQSQ
ncbi:MAG TPA: hypothetical protein VGA95_01165 [Thermodesulfobacteriota bacterium]